MPYHYAIPTNYGWVTRSSHTWYSHMAIRAGIKQNYHTFHKTAATAVRNPHETLGIIEIDPDTHLVSANRIKEIKATETLLPKG